MRKILVLSLLLLVLSLAACKNVSLQAVENVDKSGELIFPEYLRYVDADPALDAAKKDDRHKLIDSHRHNVKALKDSAK